MFFKNTLEILSVKKVVMSSSIQKYKSFKNMYIIYYSPALKIETTYTSQWSYSIMLQ